MWEAHVGGACRRRMWEGGDRELLSPQLLRGLRPGALCSFQAHPDTHVARCHSARVL